MVREHDWLTVADGPGHPDGLRLRQRTIDPSEARWGYHHAKLSAAYSCNINMMLPALWVLLETGPDGEALA